MQQRFGRYEIKEPIGHGGMGRVYRAFDPSFNRHVAIKVLPPASSQDTALHAELFREARIIAALEHPSIVPVYDVGSAHGQPYLVMRLMKGGTLSNRLRQQPLSLRQIGRLITTLCEALDAVHAKGVIHSDLKPLNILFDRRNHPYLADFGIARLRRPTQSRRSAATPQYMAPEQVSGGTITPQTDVYQMGVIAFELLTQQLPFQGDSRILAYKHYSEPPPLLRSIKPELPKALESVIQRALAKQPQHRYRSAGEFAAELTQALITNPVSKPFALPINQVALLGGIGALLLGMLWISSLSSPPTTQPRPSTPIPVIAATDTIAYPDLSHLHILYVVSASDTMNQDFDGQGKWFVLQASLNAHFSQLNPTLQSGLLAYGHAIHALDEDSCSDRNIAELVSLQKAANFELQTSLQPLRAVGRAPLNRAVDTAANAFFLVPRTGQTAIILIADGGDSCDAGERLSDTIQKVYNFGLTELPIYTIGLNVVGDGLSQLQLISRETGGRFENVQNRSELDRVLSQFSAEIIAAD